MSIIMYSSPTCPRCKVLETKLKRKNIPFSKETKEDVILEKGLKSIPWLELEDGALLDFSAANNWINEQEAGE